MSLISALLTSGCETNGSVAIIAQPRGQVIAADAASTREAVSVDAASRTPEKEIATAITGRNQRYRDVIERHGVTWTLLRAKRSGRYINGDWWVIGPVSITSITPECAREDARVQHGAMLNPDPASGKQGYDNATAGDIAYSRYSDQLNVARGVAPSTPLVVPAGSSLVSVVSHPVAGQLPQLDRCAVLTVVAEAPSPHAFRPPYCGTDKRHRWSAEALDFTCLTRLQPVAGSPSPRELVARLEHTWLDHLPGFQGRYLHPRDNMPDYGREIADLVGAAALTLNLDIPADDKRALLIVLVQLGIDIYGVIENGGRFDADGGQGSGRKLPMLLAGVALDDPELRALAREESMAFAEDAQTFYVKETSPGIFNGGHGGYCEADVGLPEWGNSHADDPSRDHKSWSTDPYRRCCTANSWVGFVLAARIMGLRAEWGHPALFDYVDRYMQIEQPGHWMRSWSPFAERMWERYRDAH